MWYRDAQKLTCILRALERAHHSCVFCSEAVAAATSCVLQNNGYLDIVMDMELHGMKRTDGYEPVGKFGIDKVAKRNVAAIARGFEIVPEQVAEVGDHAL